MVHMWELICIVVVSVTNGAQMVSPQLRVLPRSRWMLGVLCRVICSTFIQRVRLLATSLRLVVSLIPTSFSSSLPLLVIGGRLIREVMLSIDLSLRNRRTQGWSRCRLHRWWVIGRSSWRG